MTKLFRSTDAEIFALEHRFPFAATLFSLFMAGNVLEHRFPFATTLISIFLAGIVVSAIMMLIAQN
jgi:hypothetical protein